ncbi:MAG: hypothetical protein RR290_04105 [Clostridia bacterium]
MELEIVKNKDLDIEVYKEKQAFDKIVENIIDKSTDYILKAMPIQDNLKDILIDVKKSFKSKDFNKIVQTAVTSSIREGLEIIGAPISIIKDLNKLKNIALKGGLRESLNAGIEIFTNKYLKGNVLGEVVTRFVDDTKSYINSRRFTNQMDIDIDKIINKENKFKDLCKDWYKAYDKLDIDSINKIAKQIKTKEKTSSVTTDMSKATKVIYNMTEFVNTKQNKLSPTQLEICKTI